MYCVYIYQHTVKPVIQTDTNETVCPYSLNVSVHITVHPQLSKPLIVAFPSSQKLVIFHEFRDLYFNDLYVTCILHTKCIQANARSTERV